MGTNLLGRDILSQLALGARASLPAALVAGVRTVLLPAGLAFLGVGDPSLASWGGMIRDAV